MLERYVYLKYVILIEKGTFYSVSRFIIMGEFWRDLEELMED
jgi:hypothetical protein